MMGEFVNTFNKAKSRIRGETNEEHKDYSSCESEHNLSSSE